MTAAIYFRCPECNSKTFIKIYESPALFRFGFPSTRELNKNPFLYHLPETPRFLSDKKRYNSGYGFYCEFCHKKVNRRESISQSKIVLEEQ